jgi:hypothetical protein
MLQVEVRGQRELVIIDGGRYRESGRAPALIRRK